MSVESAPVFGAEEVIQIAHAFEKDDRTFVIGGQATNVWAWFFADKAPDLKALGPLTSQDIDYFGSQNVARDVAKALGGKLLIPTIDDHTPNTAQVITVINGKDIVIDFMRAVLGIRDRELQKGVSSIAVSATIDGKEATVIIKLLHPLLCLKSRVVSMLHPATRRSDTIARRQLEASIIIARTYIDDALSAGDWPEAKGCFRTLNWYLRSNEYVKRADRDLSADPLTILKGFVDDQRIDQRYRENQMSKMITEIEARRANRK
jgi:hypothetical protein